MIASVAGARGEGLRSRFNVDVSMLAVHDTRQAFGRFHDTLPQILHDSSWAEQRTAATQSSKRSHEHENYAYHLQALTMDSEPLALLSSGSWLIQESGQASVLGCPGIGMLAVVRRQLTRTSCAETGATRGRVRGQE
jgi:hypothetical protein